MGVLMGCHRVTASGAASCVIACRTRRGIHKPCANIRNYAAAKFSTIPDIRMRWEIWDPLLWMNQRGYPMYEPFVSACCLDVH